MRHIRKLADDFFESSGLKKLPVTLEDLERIAKENNWNMNAYSEIATENCNSDILKRMKLKKGFQIRTAEGRVAIFYDDNVGYLEKLKVIAHEFAHIVIGHLKSGIIDYGADKNVLETEADIFAVEFLAPVPVLIRNNISTVEQLISNCILSKTDAEMQIEYYNEYISGLLLNKRVKVYKYKRHVITVLLITILLTAVCFYKFFILNDNLKNTEEESPVTTPKNETSISAVSERNTGQEYLQSTASQDSQVKIIDPIVYITKSGQKYHREWCSSVKDSMLIETTQGDAETAGYEPCKLCHPDE